MCFSLALFTWLFSCQYSSRWAGSANGGFILCVPHRQGNSIIRFNPPIVTRNSCWKKCSWKFFAAANTLHLSLTRTLFLSHTLSIYANELCNWFDKISVKRRRVGGWEQNKAIYSIVSWQQQLVSLEWVFLLVRYLSNGQENDRYEINKAPLIESTITKIESTMSVTMDTLLFYDKLRHVYFGTNQMKK